MSRDEGGRVSVGDLGEFGLIDRIISRLAPGSVGDRSPVEIGPGDDAAVLATEQPRVVASTDVMVEAQHFRRDWSTGYDVGRKAAASSMADIAAMGAVPTGLLVALVCPPATVLGWVEDLVDGLRDECSGVGASVIGGDVSKGEVVTIAVTALGDLGGLKAVTRSGARPGDVVAVAGRLGYAAGGVAALTRGFRSPRALVDAHRRPEPPYDAGPTAALLGASAMCDVSDGLLADLGHIAAASEVAIDLRTAAFTIPRPIADASAALSQDAMRWILTGGEDHALVATFSPTVALPAAWQPIGAVFDPAERGTQVGVVTVDGMVFPGGAGHDHFRGK